jgi:hypothetical protein
MAGEKQVVNNAKEMERKNKKQNNRKKKASKRPEECKWLLPCDCGEEWKTKWKGFKEQIEALEREKSGLQSRQVVR